MRSLFHRAAVTMHLVSFNVFRTLGLPNTTVLKPDQFLQHRQLLQQADWVLFPEYWQLNSWCMGSGAGCFRAWPVTASGTTRWR